MIEVETELLTRGKLPFLGSMSVLRKGIFEKLYNIKNCQCEKSNTLYEEACILIFFNLFRHSCFYKVSVEMFILQWMALKKYYVLAGFHKAKLGNT